MKRYETVSNGTTRNTSHLSVHLHNRTHEQIADLADRLSMSRAQIISIAVADLHFAERVNIQYAETPIEYDGTGGTAADDHDGAHPADLAAFGAL